MRWVHARVQTADVIQNTFVINAGIQISRYLKVEVLAGARCDQAVAGLQLDYPLYTHPQLKVAQVFDKPAEQKLFGL